MKKFILDFIAFYSGLNAKTWTLFSTYSWINNQYIKIEL